MNVRFMINETWIFIFMEYYRFQIKGFWGYLNGGRITKIKTSLLWQGGF